MEQRAHSLASDTHSRGGRMSEPFGQCMNDISSTLKAVYKAHSAVVIPGSGSVRLLLLALPRALVFALVSTPSSLRWSPARLSAVWHGGSRTPVRPREEVHGGSQRLCVLEQFAAPLVGREGLEPIRCSLVGRAGCLCFSA